MSHAMITLPIPMNLSSEGGLAAYVRAVNKAPVLSADEERAATQRVSELLQLIVASREFQLN